MDGFHLCGRFWLVDLLMALPAVSLMLTPDLRIRLESWLAEDLGRGDLTAPALKGCSGHAHWTAKASGVFCGGVLLEPLLHALDPKARVQLLVSEGASVSVGQELLKLEGQASALVAVERTALNLAMRLSGVATATAALVDQLRDSSVRLADTRKTTPGLRVLEKYAVRCGGGVNHRCGLDDAAMLKENHLAWAGGMAAAVATVRRSAPWPAQIIIEAETADQAAEAIRAGANGLLLDEFSPAELHDLLPRLRLLAEQRPEGHVVLEASGVDPGQLQVYAQTGIDLISTSAPVTRSSWLDISMRFEPDSSA